MALTSDALTAVPPTTIDEPTVVVVPEPDPVVLTDTPPPTTLRRADTSKVRVPRSPMRAAGLDLDPLLLRSMRRGIVGSVLVFFVAAALPLWITQGPAFALGVGGQVAFWCGIGFGAIAGSAAYAAGGHPDG